MIDEDGRVSGKINQTFFVPSWATELEKVTIKFRSPAINCDANNPERNMEDELTNDSFVDESLRTKDRYNAIDERNYVAWKSETDTVTGRISSFQITDVTDYPAWQPVFRKYDKEKGRYTTELTGNAYHSGICNEYGFLGNWGSLYTTPVVGTSNPAGASMGTLGFGYKIRYKMTTVGPYYNKTDTVTFKPEFYWVNDEGKYLQIDGTYKTSMDTRAKVDVYYNETFGGKGRTLVKVGSQQDKNNRKSLTLTDDAWDVKKERIDFTNDTLHTSNVGETEPQYTFNDTCMTTAMRTVDGDTHVSAHRGNPLDKAEARQYEFNQRMYNTVKAVMENPDAYKNTDYETLASRLTPEQVARSVQTWYGEYYLPSECFVTTRSWDTVKKQIEGGFDGSEDCWLKGGHLVINFNPQINSETKQTLRYSVETKEQYTEEDGSIKFSYWGCNQFKHENCVASKLLASGEVLPFAPGDVLVYDLTNGGKDSPPKAPSAKDAYDSSGSH